MLRRFAVAALFVFAAHPVWAQDDAEGCKDHPLFNRLPNFYIYGCETKEFDLIRFPQGPLKPGDDGEKHATAVTVEGPTWKVVYQLKEDVTSKPSPLQVMRNFQNAARAGGGTIVGEYSGACAGLLDETLAIGNNCTNFGVSMRFTRGTREVWAYAQPSLEGDGYEVVIAEREAMKQEIVASELLAKIEKEGFVALYINFETGKATIAPESNALLDQVAGALKTAPSLHLEVAGHTDNVGTAESNQALSEQRAAAVRQALVSRGVAASCLTAKGYGQSSPMADNRSEEGRAKNRRVELVKK